MTDKSSGKAGRIFYVITAMFLFLVLVTLVFGLMHKSSYPQIFGRYSPAYAIVLAALFATAFYLAWVFWKGGPGLVRWTANLYTLIISMVIVLLAVEWGLRVFNPFGVGFFHNLPYHMQGMVDDPVLGYRHPNSVTYSLGSNLVELNSHGLRDDEISYNKPAGEKRVLVLGDSVTFGWGVSQGETFVDHMEYLLNELPGDRWQVINSGVNGYNTEQEATYLRIEGMRYSPDFVLLVYVSNDVGPIADPNETTWRRYPSWPSSLPEAVGRLRQLSFLFQLTTLFARMEQMDMARAAAADENRAITDRDTYGITEHPGWPVSKDALLDIAQQCEKAGIPFLVAMYGRSGTAFRAGLEEESVDILDLFPAWRGVPEGQAHVSRIDPHPSVEVHEKMAGYLVDAFHKRGWYREQ
jgi:lysophospholipase L1-like esterase